MALRNVMDKVECVMVLLTSGTSLILVCQKPLAISSTSNFSKGVYIRLHLKDGWTHRAGTSSLTTSLILEKNEANKGNVRPKHHAYVLDYLL